MSRRTLRPRPFDNKKRLTIVHDAAGLELADSTVARSIANRNTELEKNNDKVVTVARGGEEVVPVPGFRPATHYEQLYPNDFKQTDDMNAEYLTSGKNLLPLESQCVEYAADSDDEDWLQTNLNTDGQDRLSMVNFEKLIWKLEMANYMITQHTLRKAGASMMERKSKGSSAFVQHLTKAAAVKLLIKHEGFEPSVIERVYEYWTKKRRSRKEPLLRTLQPKTAANDKDPDHTFREREKIKRPNTRRRRHVNKGDNVEEKLGEIKDEMGHASNIFKSIINRESTKAHVVNVYMAQKRLLLDRLSKENGQRPSKLSDIRREQVKSERRLRRDDAEYRAKICRFLLQNVFHGNLRKMLTAPRGTEGEGGCDAAVSRRLKKAQKRRQKVISFLVRDRNWQKWHDKTWMHKMYVILKKRDFLGKMTKFINQKRTWKKWESFVKLTRDRRLRRSSDLIHKRKFSTKFAKTPRPLPGFSQEIKPEPPKSPETPAKTISAKQTSSNAAERSTSTEETAMKDAVGQEEIIHSTMTWAQKQGISTPKTPSLSKTIQIPSAFVVPQNGFSCLPPRLKEMYTEAERDATQSPNSVSQKTKLLKLRRQRIQQLMADGKIERGVAVAKFNQEWKENCDAKKQKTQMKRLKTKMVKRHSSKTGNSSKRFTSEDCYVKRRRELLKSIKTLLETSRKSRNPLGHAANPLLEHQRLIDCFNQLKAAKEPDFAFLETVAFEVGCGGSPSANGDDRMVIDSGQADVLKKRKQDELSETYRARSEKEVDSLKETGALNKKRVSLVKRRSRKLAVEIRLNKQTSFLKLEPGNDVDLQPFTPDNQSLRINELNRFVQTELSPETSNGRSEAIETFRQEPSTPMNIDREPVTDWSQVYTRTGPVAQVPVNSHRMVKTQSAPILVTDDGCYFDSAKTNKNLKKKITVGLSSSQRLLRGRGVSLSALKKRRQLRKHMLKPYLPRMEAQRCLPKTKLRKLNALRQVKMQVPSRPMRKPLFSHVFKLNRPIEPEKVHINWSLPPSLQPEILQSGVARIGRGNRVWIDRVDPFSRERLISSSRETPSQVVLPTMRRVLELDQKKKGIIKQQCEQQNQTRRLREEHKAEKANQIRDQAAQLANRQQSFLPHCLVQPKLKKQETKRRETPQKMKCGDTRKEAERLHGMAMEMGLKLPLERLYAATVAAAETSMRGDDEEDLHLASSNGMGDVTAFVAENLDEDGRTTRGVQVMPPAVGLIEDLMPVAIPQTLSPLGCVQSEGITMGGPQTTNTADKTTHCSASEPLVDVDYLSSIAPRKPRTAIDSLRSPQRQPSRTSIEQYRDN